MAVLSPSAVEPGPGNRKTVLRWTGRKGKEDSSVPEESGAAALVSKTALGAWSLK